MPFRAAACYKWWLNYKHSYICIVVLCSTAPPSNPNVLLSAILMYSSQQIPMGWRLPNGLRRLDLRWNNLSGPLPKAWVNNLPRGLEELRLSYNSLTGNLTGAMDFPPALLYLDFDDNGLQGVLPGSLRLPNRLRALQLVS